MIRIMELKKSIPAPMRRVEPAPELVDYVSRHWELAAHFAIAYMHGKTQRGVNTLLPDGEDDPLDGAQMIMDVAEGRREKLGGVRTFRIQAYHKSDDGLKSEPQSSLEFTLEPAPADVLNQHDAIERMLSTQIAHNRFLVERLVTVSTALASSQAKTIESLSAKAMVGLEQLEHAIRAQADQRRDQIESETRQETIRAAMAMIERVAPALVGQLRNHFSQATSPDADWRRLVESLSADQRERMRRDLDPTTWMQVQSLFSATGSTLRDGLADMGKTLDKLAPLLEILELDQQAMALSCFELSTK